MVKKIIDYRWLITFAITIMIYVVTITLAWAGYDKRISLQDQKIEYTNKNIDRMYCEFQELKKEIKETNKKIEDFYGI